MIGLNAAGLRGMLARDVSYYTRCRTHLSLAKDSPVPRAVQEPSARRIVATAEVGGLHHRYDRVAA
jgi:putative transposase